MKITKRNLISIGYIIMFIMCTVFTIIGGIKLNKIIKHNKEHIYPIHHITHNRLDNTTDIYVITNFNIISSHYVRLLRQPPTYWYNIRYGTGIKIVYSETNILTLMGDISIKQIGQYHHYPYRPLKESYAD